MASNIPDYSPRSNPAGGRRRNGFRLAVTLARRPCFCCGCWCLRPSDARRARRIFRIVRKAAAARQI